MAFSLMPWIAPDALAATEAGSRVRVVDGDTIVMGKQRIRLHGIDAPESRQKCEKDGKSWACGKEASKVLRKMAELRELRCEALDRDRYGRIVAICQLVSQPDDSINARMVREGWALAYRRYSRDYIAEELAARQKHAGIWRGDFVPPWDWRRGARLTQFAGLPGKCRIKGNINARGQRIFHVPGGRYCAYAQIKAGSKERWFCTITEARDAGWRQSRK